MFSQWQNFPWEKHPLKSVLKQQLFGSILKNACFKNSVKLSENNLWWCSCSKKKNFGCKKSQEILETTIQLPVEFFTVLFYCLLNLHRRWFENERFPREISLINVKYSFVIYRFALKLLVLNFSHFKDSLS